MNQKLISCICFFLVAFNLDAQVAPGGVSNGLSLWTRADAAIFSDLGSAPVTNGGMVQQWNNAPGLGAYNFTQTTAGKRPTLYTTTSAKLFNFNPLIEFDPMGGSGNGDRMGFSTAGTNLFGTDQLTVFMAQRLRSTAFTQVWFKWQTDPTAGTRVGFENAGSNLRFDVAGSNNVGNPTGVPIGGIHRAVMSVWANTSASAAVYGAGQAAGSRVRIDGKEGTTVNATAATTFTSTQELAIGANNNLEDTYYSELDISEVIIYKRGLLTQERNKVDTYLGIKYGLSLYHNYVATDNTVVWNYAANPAYNYGIIGIARDDQTALLQKQSMSMSRLNDAVAVSDILTISLDNKALTNSSNTNSFTSGDKSFLLVGCNRDVLAGKSTENPSGVYTTLSREWFAQQANFSNPIVTLEFDFNASTFGPLSTDSLFFLMDDDGNFSNATLFTATSIGMTINSNKVTIKLSAVQLSAKPYFTFGKVSCGKINFNLGNIQAKCNGDNNGKIFAASTTGGSSPYQYAIGNSPFSTLDTFSNLAAGTYKVYVKDANGCLDSASRVLPEPAALILDTLVTASSCPEIKDGKIVGSASGGTNPYQFKLANGSFTGTSTFANLDSGFYTLTLRDANLCAKSLTAYVSAGPSIDVTSRTDTSICEKSSIILKAEGAISYVWDKGVQNNIAFVPTNTEIYKVIGTNAKGCQDSAFVEISVIPLANPKINSTPAFCSSDKNIQLTAATNGGLWSGNGISDPTNGFFDPQLAGLGNHRIIYEIAGTCTVSDTLFIQVNKQQNAQLNPAGPFCENAGIQQLVTLEPGGVFTGTGVNAAGQFDPMAAGIGTHRIIYTLNGTCPDADTILILVNSTFDATILPGGPYCVSDGPVNLQANTPGASWSGNGIIDAALGTFDPKLAGVGNHTVTHLIAGTCGTTDTEIITVLALDTARITPVPTLCHNAQALQLSANLANGTWSGSNTTPTGVFTVTTSGIFTVYYTHKISCAYTDSFQISVSEPINIVLPNSSVACKGDANGTLQASVSGGTPNYTYNWTDNSSITSANRTALTAGNYTLSVTDINNCAAQASAVVSEPSAIAFTPGFKLVNDSCYMACKAAVFAPATGGAPSANGYTYSINPNMGLLNGNGIQNLCAGSYTLRLSDANACFIDSAFTLTEPQKLSVSAQSTPESCDKENGTASALNSQGGTPNYTYTWVKTSNGNTYAGSSLSNLAFGMYTLTMRDALLCEATSTVLVDTIAKPLVSISTNPVSCFKGNDGSAVASGSFGKTPYTYLWNSNETSSTLNGKVASTVSISLRDADGCLASASANITEPSAVVLAPIADSILCFNSHYIQNLAASGGNSGNYSYTLNGQILPSNQLDISTPNTYSLRAYDSKGCASNTINFTISLITAIKAQIQLSADSICKGTSTLVNASATGGKESYSYKWNNSFTADSSTYQSKNVTVDSLAIYVVASDGCAENDTARAVVHFFKTPTITTLISSPLGCVPHSSEFTLLNTDLTNVQWNLGDGTLINSEDSFNHTYLRAGEFALQIQALSSAGCPVNLTLPKALTVYSLPAANFGFSPDKPSVLNTEVNFYDYSFGNIATWNWLIYNTTDTLLNYSGRSLNYNFPALADGYLVKLVVITANACQDSLTRAIRIEKDWAIYVPNSFTPNNDNHNDFFNLSAFGIANDAFTFELFNRWGELIFSTMDLNFKWDGTHNGVIQKEDLYTWRLSAKVEGSAFKILEFGKVSLLK